MMTKKNYVAIAKVFADEYNRRPTTTRRQQIVTLAHLLADIFEKDNPRFDRTRFIEACYGSAQ